MSLSYDGQSFIPEVEIGSKVSSNFITPFLLCQSVPAFLDPQGLRAATSNYPFRSSVHFTETIRWWGIEREEENRLGILVARIE